VTASRAVALLGSSGKSVGDTSLYQLGLRLGEFSDNWGVSVSRYIADGDTAGAQPPEIPGPSPLQGV
jgi:hypothetical protein